MYALKNCLTAGEHKQYMTDMYLFKRGKYYYVQYKRGKKKSLAVTDGKVARRLLAKLKRAELEKKIAFLDSRERISISEFALIWTKNPDRKELSEKTLRSDELAFNLLKDALGDIPLKLVDKEAIRRFKEITLARVKPTSVNSYLRHIKSGLNWAKEEGYIDKVPTTKMYKTGKTLTRYLSREEVETIRSYALEHNPEMYRVIQFALFTGCRRGEIVRARYEHIQGKAIRIKGKGDKERIIPLLPDALKEQQDIGKIFRYSHVSTISNYFRKIARACGIQCRFHDLRHAAGTQMLASGIDLKTVKEILGHTDIRTTEIYAHVLAETMEKEMTKLNYD